MVTHLFFLHFFSTNANYYTSLIGILLRH